MPIKTILRWRAKTRLNIVLTRLRQHGLVNNLEKCVFGVPSIDFLGYRVDATRVSTLPSYVSAIHKFPRSGTVVKELQGFLGLLNFYHRFLPAVAATLHPLTDALKRGRKGTELVEWSPEMEVAFRQAKMALANSTQLSHPLPGAVISLLVDASATHIGAGLHQRQAGKIGHLGPLVFFLQRSWSRLKPACA